MKHFLLAIVVCLLVFAGDLLIARGYVEWLLYIVPLLLIYRAGRMHLTFAVLGLIAVLLGLGYLLSPDPGLPPIISLIARIEGFLAFVAYSLLINALLRSQRTSVEARISAEKRSEEITAMNRELEAFSYSVSHDLRNPLLTIGAFTDILREDYGEHLDQDGKGYLNRISDAVRKMQQLIDDMLSLSKISRQELSLDEFDLSDMASAIMNELAHTNPERSVSWTVQQGMRVHADPRLMNIALSNLLGNAWKYTGKTENARIEMGAQVQIDKYVYYIRDNGAGFDMSHADSLFAPFRRLHSESEFKGTGIGLAIVERIITRHGGRVWAEAQPEKGATFYFTLD